MEIQPIALGGVSGLGGAELHEAGQKGSNLQSRQAVALHQERPEFSNIRQGSAPGLERPVNAPMSKEAIPELSKLSDSGSIMFDIGELMKALHQFALTQYEFSKEARHAERDLVQSAYAGQADKIREQASKERISGWMSASFTMASGAMELGGAVKGLQKLGELKGPQAKLNKIDTDISDLKSSPPPAAEGGADINRNKIKEMEVQREKEFVNYKSKVDEVSSRVQNINNFADGGSQALAAFGQFVSSQFDYEAKQAEAGGKLLEANQKLHESAMDDEKARVDFYKDMLNDCKDKLDKILTGANQSSKNITAKA